MFNYWLSQRRSPNGEASFQFLVATNQGQPTITHVPPKAVSSRSPLLILMSSPQDVPSSVPKDHSKTLNQALLQHTASVSDEAMVELYKSQLGDLGQKHLPS